MRQLVVLLLLTGFFATGCIRKKTKQESLKCGVESQPTCGNANQVSTPVIFKAKCATCHQFDKNGTGPPLQGMMKRVPNREWLMGYLQNEDSLIRSGDTASIRISRMLPAGSCHKFRGLTYPQLDEIIRYTEQRK